MYHLAAAAIGLFAYALLASPLCPASADRVGGWDPLAVVPMIAASTIAAWVLRKAIRRRGNKWLFVAGVAYPFLASLVFAALFLLLERTIQGRLGFASAVAEAILGCAFGPLYCGVVGYVTIPLGILGVVVLRRTANDARESLRGGSHHA